MRRAVIDIGTNSTLLLIADVVGGSVGPAIRDTAVSTRLGEGLADAGEIRQEAFERTAAAVQEYLRECAMLDVVSIDIIGTAVFRKAANAERINRMLHERTGIRAHILSEEEESRLSFLSVMDGFGDLDKCLVVDIGGGSTEIAAGNKNGILHSASIPVGAVTLAERFCTDDPPGAAAGAAMSAYVLERLPALPEMAGELSAAAVGGTATTAAALLQELQEFDPDKIDGTLISTAEVDGLLSRVVQMPLESRKALEGMEPGRADIFPAGLAILSGVLQFYCLPEIRVSVRGVRYGYLMK